MKRLLTVLPLAITFSAFCGRQVPPAQKIPPEQGMIATCANPKTNNLGSYDPQTNLLTFNNRAVPNLNIEISKGSAEQKLKWLQAWCMDDPASALAAEPDLPSGPAK